MNERNNLPQHQELDQQLRRVVITRDHQTGEFIKQYADAQPTRIPENVSAPVEPGTTERCTLRAIDTDKTPETSTAKRRRWLGAATIGVMLVGSGYMTDVGRTYLGTGEIIGPQAVIEDAFELPDDIKEFTNNTIAFVQNIDAAIDKINQFSDTIMPKGDE